MRAWKPKIPTVSGSAFQRVLILLYILDIVTMCSPSVVVAASQDSAFRTVYLASSRDVVPARGRTSRRYWTRPAVTRNGSRRLFPDSLVTMVSIERLKKHSSFRPSFKRKEISVAVASSGGSVCVDLSAGGNTNQHIERDRQGSSIGCIRIGIIGDLRSINRSERGIAKKKFLQSVEKRLCLSK